MRIASAKRGENILWEKNEKGIFLRLCNMFFWFCLQITLHPHTIITYICGAVININYMQKIQLL